MKKRVLGLIAWAHLFAIGSYRSILMHLFSLFPIKTKKVILVSYSGKGYGDSGKYIADEIFRRDKTVSIYWATKDNYKESLPKYVAYTKFGSKKYADSRKSRATCLRM